MGSTLLLYNPGGVIIFISIIETGKSFAVVVTRDIEITAYTYKVIGFSKLEIYDVQQWEKPMNDLINICDSMNRKRNGIDENDWPREACI